MMTIWGQIEGYFEGKKKQKQEKRNQKKVPISHLRLFQIKFEDNFGNRENLGLET